MPFDPVELMIAEFFMPVFALSDKIEFPPVHLTRYDGLLAVGGDLSEKRILLAYRSGIFPWYGREDPILWWSPDPRLVLFPSEIKISKSLKKTIKKGKFRITMDRDFEGVIHACAQVRLNKGEETWLGGEMIRAYTRLHKSGYAHSVEAWCDGRLVGGLYGLSLGRTFFGESMFSCENDASKVAFAALAGFAEERSFDMIDCQVSSPHLKRLGAREISREEYLKILEKSLVNPDLVGSWDYGYLR